MRPTTLRKRAYQILEKPQPGDTLSRIFDLFILSLITLNIVALMIETIPAFAQAWGPYFRHFNTVSVIIFSAEYLVRI